MKKIVWEFTNQKKLTASEFVDYFERKVFRTIRKYGMLKSREVSLIDDGSLNFVVLKNILSKKFLVRAVKNGKVDFSNENLSAVAEEIFANVLKGKFEGAKPVDKIARPLYFHSDAEIELYASLVGLKGKKRKVNSRVRELFDKFIKKNQDLEINVVNAMMQLEK